MKYKIFIKTILTLALFDNYCALNAEYVRDVPEEYEKAKKALESQKAREEAQRKTPPTAKEQADISKLRTAGYSQNEAEVIARKKPEAGGVTVEAALKARGVKTDPATKLTETVAALPDTFKVREEAKKREEAKEAEAAQARYLPAAGLGLPSRVPTLVAPTMPAKPLGEGVPLSTTPKLQPLTRPDAPEKEPEEAIKKQTEELRRLNASDAEIEYLMKLEPKTRALEMQKLRESISREVAGIVRDTTKPTTAKPLSAESTESQVRAAEEATRKKTEALEQQEAKKKQATATQAAQPIDLEAVLKETNRQIATQEAENKKL
ncbi:MAG: hypothetical protein WCS92_04710, partial [Candidatus Babeliales bacterium]